MYTNKKKSRSTTGASGPRGRRGAGGVGWGRGESQKSHTKNQVVAQSAHSKPARKSLTFPQAEYEGDPRMPLLLKKRGAAKGQTVEEGALPSFFGRRAE